MTSRRILLIAFALSAAPVFADSFFLPGNLVVTLEGNGVYGATTGNYTDNQAAPLTLFQYTTTGTYVNSLVLPQIRANGNFEVSGEYGSTSEGTLQLSGDGHLLTVMGYGIDAASFNSPAPGTQYSPDPLNKALGQSGSLQNQSYTAVPRVVAVIDSNGNVNSSTAIYGVFDANNPRSAYTANGTTFYISGQGTDGDTTGGVFFTQLGTHSATSITGNDAGSGSAQDTRVVQIYNNTLYVSADSKKGNTNRDYVGTLGAAGTPPTTLANGSNGPTRLTNFATSTGKITVTATTTNGINTAGSVINLSPENYFFANAATLYIADNGLPKNDSGDAPHLGDGGLQKWVNSKPDGTGNWSLAYTLSAGLGLVPNSNASGTSGLYGLTGMVIGTQVELFATTATIGDIDQTYLYGITDTLSAITGAGETFTQLAAAPVDSTFKGVAFAPTTPEPGSFVLLGLGAALLLAARRRR